MDAEGNPLPWFTYAAIAFLRKRMPVGSCVWEWGSGYSTLWWLQHGCKVTSCEHDAKWAELVARMSGDGVEILLRPLGAPYAAAIEEAAKSYDIVVIDGELTTREACAEACLRALKPDGVVVVDDTDLALAKRASQLLVHRGFKQIEFEGLKPAQISGSATSVLYRDGNCLGI